METTPFQYFPHGKVYVISQLIATPNLPQVTQLWFVKSPHTTKRVASQKHFTTCGRLKRNPTLTRPHLPGVKN